jgi:hypothetical protein
MESLNKEERRRRIVALRRLEDRNKRLPLLLQTLTNITGEQISENQVLTFDEIDKHQIELNSSDFDFNYLSISFPLNKSNELTEKVKALSSNLDQINLFVLSKWREIAVFKINTAFVIENVVKLLDLDGDCFYVYDLTYTNGLWVDLYSDHWFLEGSAELRQILELRVFGKEWMKKVANVM